MTRGEPTPGATEGRRAGETGGATCKQCSFPGAAVVGEELTRPPEPDKLNRMSRFVLDHRALCVVGRWTTWRWPAPWRARALAVAPPFPR